MVGRLQRSRRSAAAFGLTVTSSGPRRYLAAMVRMLAFLIGLFVAAACLAQADPVVACRVCFNHGSTPCGKHGKLFDKEQPAAGTTYCSVVSDCKHCGGSLAIDCKTCKNVPVETELERRQKLAREWLSKRRADHDAITNNVPLFHLVTPHCDLVFSIRPTTIGKEKVDTHPLMHIYGQRIEALRDLFLKTLEVPDRDLPNRLRIFMFRDAQDHAIISPRVTDIGTTNSTGTKLMGTECVYSMWQDLRGQPDDEGLHRTLVHNTTHLLLSNMLPSQFLGNRKHGWIDEGTAHWFEDKVTGRCLNYCFEEIMINPGTHWKGGRWRAPVRKMVDDGKCKPFADLSILNTDQLDFEAHAVAFAYVDFLITAHGGAKFRDLIRLVKRTEPLVPIRDALQTVYGWNPLTIDAPFQQWVKDNYSPLEPR